MKNKSIRTLPGKLNPFTPLLTFAIHIIPLATNDASLFTCLWFSWIVILIFYSQFDFSRALAHHLEQVKKQVPWDRDKSHKFFYMILTSSAMFKLQVMCVGGCVCVHAILGLPDIYKGKTTIALHNYIFFHHLCIPKLCWSEFKRTLLLWSFYMISVYGEV